MKKTFALLGLLCSLVSTSQANAGTDVCANVGARLNAMASADQQVRLEWQALASNPATTGTEKNALQERWKGIDDGNLRELKEIIAACGWPTTARDSHSAWLLSQHADRDVAFQHQARGLLAASVEAGIGAPRDLAYLADRIAANEGRPQEYGTQLMQTDRCQLSLAPIDDRERANRRRLAIGLQSLEEYEAEGRRRFIPADCPGEDAAPAK